MSRNTLRLAVVGSRSLGNNDIERDWMFYHLDMHLGLDILRGPEEMTDYPPHLGLAILSGGAIGIDRAAQDYAELNDIPFFLYKPYHLIDNKVDYSPRYFFTRNKQIVDNCDEMIAFWDGESNGTADAIKFCNKRGKPCRIIQPNME